MSYTQDIQALLAKYPEIKSIKVVREETIERGIIPPVPAVVVKPVAKDDLFTIDETVKDFPTKDEPKIVSSGMVDAPTKKKKLDPIVERAIASANASVKYPGI